MASILTGNCEVTASDLDRLLHDGRLALDSIELSHDGEWRCVVQVEDFVGRWPLRRRIRRSLRLTVPLTTGWDLNDEAQVGILLIGEVQEIPGRGLRIEGGIPGCLLVFTKATRFQITEVSGRQ